jgi:hypothetical protein
VITALLATALLLAQAPPPQTSPPAPPPQQQGTPLPGGRVPAEVASTGVLKLFLDCQYECDTEFLRQELTFVDHVRDSQSADIHALITTQTTGGGGTSWKIQFIGLGRFAGHDEAVTFTTQQTATADERRRELLKWLKVGLATHAAMAQGRADFDIVFAKPAAGADPAAPVHDPWDAWVFSLSTNGSLSGEASSKYSSYRFNGSASRVTEAWKINFSNNWSRSESTFEVSETNTVKSLTSSWSSSALVVKSLGEQWSAAVRGSATGSTFSNYDLSSRVMAGVEYDFFPYSESTRRSLTVSYMAGVAHYNYRELTIFDKLTETKPEHNLVASLGLRQPWGSISGQTSFSQHLDDLSKSRLNMYGSANVRLFKGFSFNVFGDYSRIRDQINLRKGDISEEEVLLRLRQLATGYQYYVGFGITYRFGSIYNNVVNPRFGGGGGTIIFF